MLYLCLDESGPPISPLYKGENLLGVHFLLIWHHVGDLWDSKGALLDWRGFFGWKKRRKFCRVRPSCFVLDLSGRLGLRLPLGMMTFPCRNSTASVYLLLWTEIKLSIVDGPSTSVTFPDWVDCK